MVVTGRPLIIASMRVKEISLPRTSSEDAENVGIGENLGCFAVAIGLNTVNPSHESVSGKEAITEEAAGTPAPSTVKLTPGEVAQRDGCEGLHQV